jgi:UDP-N-acetylmuramoyl-tripeptide--D-alanyl-D-alanine ligase
VTDRTANWIAQATGGRVVRDGAGAMTRATIDSRDAGPGTLFVGLPGETADGGTFAPSALEQGAWGVLVAEPHADAIARRPPATGRDPQAVIAVDHPLSALHALARAWRRELQAQTIGITGSTGKTSTKDILTALLRPHLKTHASRENWNTEIGLPLTILEAEPGTEALVLEMAMRGAGQIAELVAIAEPDVGVIVNVGPVHLELLGTVEDVAAAKAELIRDMRSGAGAVVPHGQELLAKHLRKDLQTLTFGAGGDVQLAPGGGFELRGEQIDLDLPYDQPHNLLNTCAAIAAASLIGVTPSGRVDVRFSSLRGELVELPGGITVVNDCYNANPMSMRAALDHLADSPAERRIAVLGTMAELGPDAERYHHEIGAHAADLDIDVLVTVGQPALPYAATFDGETYPVATPEEAGALIEEIARPGDRVLVKGSRSVGLERVLEPDDMAHAGSHD